MEVLIRICYEHITYSSKIFITNSKAWLNYPTIKNRIVFSHSLKLYAKNFECTLHELKKLISIAKKMNPGTKQKKII